ncbi:MAG: thioredoxin family protein [Myxococcota bacterium]|jgi:peroxiredoxin|nr:thioredoxin family protein [Myxococcota bacterium]
MNVARLSMVIALTALGCQSKATPERPSVSSLQPATSTSALSASVAAAEGPAALGAPAPDFKLPDLDGNSVSLSSFRGKTVVLEWFNPECPFVKASHTKGSLKGTAARYADKGVVWLAINSNAPGKQGAGREINSAARDKFGLKHPILLDESGAVGKLYGAQRTPHLFVIDPSGNLVYRGAPDNSPDGEGDSPTSGTLVRHIDVVLSELEGKKPISVKETEAYGCSVKYGG